MYYQRNKLIKFLNLIALFILFSCKTDSKINKVNWVKAPLIVGIDLKTANLKNIKHKFGRIQVIIFVSSWCLRCQEIVFELKKIEYNFLNKYIDFIYIFSEDKFKNAREFVKYYNIKMAFMGNDKISHDFHNPNLPSIYISDRFGFLTKRYINVSKKDLINMQIFLKNISPLI